MITVQGAHGEECHTHGLSDVLGAVDLDQGGIQVELDHDLLVGVVHAEGLEIPAS